MRLCLPRSIPCPQSPLAGDGSLLGIYAETAEIEEPAIWGGGSVVVIRSDIVLGIHFRYGIGEPGNIVP
jgi:hypothetical protein